MSDSPLRDVPKLPKRGRPLRVAAIFQDPTNPPPWGIRLLEDIFDERQFELCALIKPFKSRQESKGSAFARAWLAFEQMIFALPKEASPNSRALANQTLPIFRAADKANIAAMELDVLLDFSDQYGFACDGELARHGIWFLGFPVNEPGLAGLAELASQEPIARLPLLRRIPGRQDPVWIEEGVLNLKFVASRTGLFMLEMAVPFLLRELRWAWQLGQPRQSGTTAFQRRSPPNSLQAFRYLVTLGGKLMMRAFEKFGASVGLRPKMFYLISNIGSLDDFDPKTANTIIPHDNRFYADPFLWEHDGECYCFFEDYDYRAGNGHISVGKFENGQLTDIRPVLKLAYHLSFPFLFEDSGTLYMMPETFNSSRLEVWKCVSFPDHWELFTIAFEGFRAADSTLTKVADTWWLFTSIAADTFLDTSSTLYIFQVDGPDLSNPKPHVANPVIFNSRKARNGGRVIEIDGDLFRISQDNSHGLYGYGINIMKISHLSLTEYREERVSGFAPDFVGGIDGCHHLDIRGGRVVMDVRKKFGGFAKRS